jgi:DNA mismatch repair ATPase MutS
LFHLSLCAEPICFSDGSKEIVFLYRLVPGLATRSFGVWVGKLAGIPQEVLVRAQEKGDEMRLHQVKKVVERMLGQSFGSCGISTSQEAVDILGRAKVLIRR